MNGPAPRPVARTLAALSAFSAVGFLGWGAWRVLRAQLALPNLVPHLDHLLVLSLGALVAALAAAGLGHVPGRQPKSIPEPEPNPPGGPSLALAPAPSEAFVAESLPPPVARRSSRRARGAVKAIPRPASSRDPAGALLLAIGAWVLFAGLTVGLGFALREGGVRAGDADLAAKIATPALLWSAGGLALSFLASWAVLRRLAPGADPILLPVVAVLCSIGWLFLASVGPDLAAHRGKEGFAGMAGNHLRWTLLGLAACLGAVVLSQRGWLKRMVRLKYLMAIAYLVLICANGFFGTEREFGARVLQIGPIAVQTIEIGKYLFMFFAAGYLAEEAEWVRAGDRLDWKLVAPWLLVVGVGLAPVLWPLKEVGPTVLIGLAVLALLYAGTRSARLVAGLAVTGLVAGTASYAVGFPGVVRRRMDAFLYPFESIEQVAQGLWSLAAGGWNGTGLTSSTAYRVPIIESDYAFAGWVEMTGLAGGTALLLLYGLLCWRGLEAARWADDRFEGGLALGLTAVLASQIVMIVAGTLALAPLTGITVPFVSHGGISLVTNFIAIGALLSISARPGAAPDPDRDRPVRQVGAAWAVLFGLLAVGLFQRSVGGAEELAAHPFVGVGRQARLQGAVDAGAVVRDESGTFVRDSSVSLSGYLAADVDRQLTAGTIVGLADGSARVSERCCSVQNPRTAGSESAIVRGRILDRAGRVLAESVAIPGSRRRARVYPYGAAMFDVTGVHHPLLVATTGVETRLDDVLRGEQSGDARRGLGRLVSRRDAGDDVQTTVDAGLSQRAWKLLAREGDGVGATSTGRGAVVVIDARSGEILAAVSRPAWDPNTWAIESDDEGTDRWQDQADPAAWEAVGYDRSDHPRVSRALDTRYPPGSTFKLVIGATWLESGRDPEHRVTCRGGAPTAPELPGCHRHGRHPSPDLREAIAESCNAWFGAAGIEVGPAAQAIASDLGFGREWDLLAGVPGRRWPVLASLAWSRSGDDASPVPWDLAFFARNPKKVARAAIGQDTVEATPFQMAMVAAAVATGGSVVPPRLVSSLRVAPDPSRPDQPGPIWATPEPSEPVRAFGEETADVLHEGMAGVMTEGTGRRLPSVVRGGDGHYRLLFREGLGEDADVVSVAGKSGTADVCTSCSLDPHAWMVAWAPADGRRRDAKVVVAAFVENGGSGAAGKLALEVLATALNVVQDQGPDPVPVELRVEASTPVGDPVP